jgi:hypothetical protein
MTWDVVIFGALAEAASLDDLPQDFDPTPAPARRQGHGLTWDAAVERSHW